jgi:hypothetical protein
MVGDVSAAARSLPQMARFPVEQDGEIRLGQEQKGDEEGESGNNQRYPLGPAPAKRWCGCDPTAGNGGYRRC